MKRILLTIAVAVVFTTGVVLGQTPQVITLQDAIELALENNFSLKQAENNLELADNRIISEYADFLPSISSSAGYSKTTGQQFVQDILAFDNVTSQGASGRIGGDIIVFNGLENLLSLRQSEYDKLSFEETVQRAREDVVFNTASAYLTLLVNQELLDIAIDNLETSRIVLEQTTAQVEVGARAPVDQFNQESTVATNELTVIQRENQVRLSKVQLVRQLQIDPLGDYEFERPDVDPANYTLAVNAEELELRDLIQEALETRSDIKSEEANIESQELDLLLARSNFLPTISASASISTRWSDPYFLPDASFGDQFFDQQVNKGWGFSISLPLFQNMNRVYSVQSATVQLKNAELSLENSKLGVVQEVTQAFNDFIAFTKQLESAEKALIASEKALETQQERYNVGASTLIELSEAQSTYVSAQSDYTQAQFNLIFQEKLLDYYLGKLNHTNIEF